MREFAENGSRRPGFDAAVTTAIFCCGLVYTLPFLAEPGFLRHTEADRTLIAWETVHSGNPIVPSLFGDEFLSKPPLYYWLTGLILMAAGAPTEAHARLVSALATALLAAGTFAALRAARVTRIVSASCALLPATSALFFSYSIKAEIDALFAALCAGSLLAGYLLCLSGAFGYAVLAALLLAAATLTKGAPALFFYAVSMLSFLFVASRWETSGAPVHRSRLVRLHLFVLAAAVCTLVAWGAAVAWQIGTEELVHRFQVELLGRFTGTSTRERAWHFYFERLPARLLPWSVFGVGYLALLAPAPRKRFRELLATHPAERQFACFCVCVLVPALVVFSLSAGKADRYLLPLYPFFAPFLLGGAVAVKHSRLEKALLSLSAAAVAGLAGTMLVAAYLLDETPLASNAWFSATAIVAASALYLWGIHAKRQFAPFLLCALAVLVLSARVPFRLVFAPYENARRSVANVIDTIDASLSASEPLFVLEAFERWVPYYLVRRDRTILRVTPEIASRFAQEPPRRVRLLLSMKDEHWRLEQIDARSGSTSVVADLRSNRHHWKLLEVDSTDLIRFEPREIFPTRPTPSPDDRSGLVLPGQ